MHKSRRAQKPFYKTIDRSFHIILKRKSRKIPSVLLLLQRHVQKFVLDFRPQQNV